MRAAVAAVFALALAGCADTPRVSFVDHGTYARSYALYGARTGEMPLVVLGNPTADAADQLNQAVAAALKGTHPDYRVVFVPAASPEPKGYRTVVVFGGTTVNAICGMTAGPTIEGAPVATAAAYCFDDRMFSYAQGKMPAVTSSGDSNLQEMVTALGIGIFPYNRFHDRGDCGLLMGC